MAYARDAESGASKTTSLQSLDQAWESSADSPHAHGAQQSVHSGDAPLCLLFWAKAPRLVSASVGESCRRAPPPRVCCLLLTGWCVVVARERSSLSRLQSIWPAYTSRSVRHEVRRRGQRRSDRGRRRPPLTPAADIRSRSKNVLACGRTARRRRIPCPNSRRKSSSSREKHSGALFGAVMELDRSRARMNATTQDHPR